ncbi:DUF4862 family protein [Cryobacterium sp. Y50]|uniref:DUF4862 family protein n=1 Tax=Cryobacterium sp. Y50 TaxID=2048286 RepID=UPI000CE4DC03|nr:DUF4862 family protein [Cryobacterium sp. Y50]
MNYVIGAYAAAPSTQREHKADEERYYSEVAALPGFGGLELAFDTSLHPFDEEWLLQQIKPNWTVVITLIPGTVNRLALDANFGLASESAEGRQAAIDFCEQARQAVARVNDAAGAAVVAAVEVHSAPRAISGSVTSSGERFAESLTVLGRRDWSGAKLVVEHCDAPVPGQTPSKGFLSQSAELEAVGTALRNSSTEFGVSVNWARSVIEARQVDGAVDHVRAAQAAGLLAGVMFSGCAAEATAYGEGWADAHLPPAKTVGVTGTAHYTAQTSLLTHGEMRRTLQALDPLDPLDFCGLKVSAPRRLHPDARERIAIVRDALAVLSAAIPTTAPIDIEGSEAVP